jgi:Fatty acid desaturase.
MASAQPSTSEILPLDDMRRRVRDLFEPRPALYWLDFLFHITLFWALFVFAVSRPDRPLIELAALLVCVPVLYRCVVFIHELAHLRRGTMTLFRWTWNLLCGFPMLLPSFTYAGVHNHHHRRSVYGTLEDGEYHPFASRPPLEAVGVVAASFLLPALLILRFVILTPLSWLLPRVRLAA